MSKVSLIVLERRDQPAPALRLGLWREAIVEAGHEIELIHLRTPSDAPTLPEAYVLHSREIGLATDAFEGLDAASGDVLIVVDGTRAFPPSDLVRLIDPLASGQAQVAVGDGQTSGWRKLIIAGMRPLTGSWAPFSSLIGVTRDGYEAVKHEFKPVGHRFTLEILARIREGRTDVEMLGDGKSGSTALHFDDIRHFKRLADDKLGNLSRLIQFCAVGASGMVVDLTCYALFQWLFVRTWMANWPTWIGSPLDLVAASILSIGVALCWNFTLNRHLTFNYAKKGPLFSQFITYVLSNALGVTLSLTLRLWLPRSIQFFADHKLAAAVVGIVAATGISFSMSRWVVFRTHPVVDSDAEPIHEKAEQTQSV
jgi:dolichol-phosphate mannosyltransferase